MRTGLIDEMENYFNEMKYEGLDVNDLRGVLKKNHDPYQMPRNSFLMNDEGVAKFNKIVDYYWELDTIPVCKISSSGRVLNSSMNGTYKPYKGMYIANTKIYVYLLNFRGKDWKFVWERDGAIADEIDHISPAQVIKKMTALAKKYDNTDLHDFYVEDGSDRLEEVEKPMIWGDEQYYSKTLTKVHHLDINSAYPAGVVANYPQLKNTLQYLFDTRKTHPGNKLLMNRFIGVCHSVKWGQHANYIDLAIAAKKWCNDFIKNYIKIFEETGRKVIAINTDGIWYQGEIYHDENEGTALGQWKNDHVNCTFRMKSGGCYEFMENGQYHPVVRGETRLDKILPREEWSWGDIFRAPVWYYRYTEDGHIITIEEK